MLILHPSQEGHEEISYLTYSDGDILFESVLCKNPVEMSKIHGLFFQNTEFALLSSAHFGYKLWK